MEAKIIIHHPKMLDRWAKNIVQWYKVLGPVATKKRTDFLNPRDIEAVDPLVKEEFKKNGYTI